MTIEQFDLLLGMVGIGNKKKLKKRLMTLKEKFNGLVPKEFGGMQEPLLSECEEIADDYAMDFVSWLMDNCQLIKDNITDENVLWRFDSEDYTIEGLLKIFKTSSGL